MRNLDKFTTQIINLEAVRNQRFVIPTYQRPYVWQEEQISKLLDDCAHSFSHDSAKPYFIGTVLTSEQKGVQELIDGQQRFTTLWLIAVVFHKKNISSDLIDYLKLGNQLRLGFEIRTEVEAYFNLLEASPSDALKRYSEEELETSPYLQHISKAVSTIEGKLDTLSGKGKNQIDLPKFGDYLYSKVFMVNNEAPAKINLNKLFATLNNSGVQLEQTDIVKANLLKRIRTDKVLFSKIWEACENMDDFFERNVRKLFPKTNWNSLEPWSFEWFKSDVFLYEEEENQTGENETGLTIREIIDNPTAREEERGLQSTFGSKNEIHCRPIISFGQFLLHAYRIFLRQRNQEDFDGTFHINRLIQVFRNLEKKPENEVKAFFKLLWRLRYFFDKEVIKWLVDMDGKTEHLERSEVRKQNSESKSKTYFGREKKAKSNSLMLQSVLYFTGDYLRQYWLTPFLYRLLDSEERNEKKPRRILESIDNILSISFLTDKEVSYALCDPAYKEEQALDLEIELNTANGTRTKHYWFQKLEYILWKGWDKNDPKIKEFRVTSKNSVEHVFPQNHEFGEKLAKEELDAFGNLALLNVSQNSSYSHQDVRKKKIDFDSKSTFDSLKLSKIYDASDLVHWGKSQIRAHQKEMIKLLKDHYDFL